MSDSKRLTKGCLMADSQQPSDFNSLNLSKRSLASTLSFPRRSGIPRCPHLLFLS
jgi:hypothetical protein